MSTPDPNTLTPLVATTSEPVTDTWTVRLVVIFVGLVALAGLGCFTWLMADVQIVDGKVDATWAASVAVLLSIVTGCITALAALLASTRSMRN